MLEDIDALPPELIGEIIDGVLYTRNPPSLAHQFAAGEVHLDLGLAFGRGRGGPGGWWILSDPALALRRDEWAPRTKKRPRQQA